MQQSKPYNRILSWCILTLRNGLYLPAMHLRMGSEQCCLMSWRMAQKGRIAYTSRTLNQAEQNYSQLEREALAIVSGVKKFHPYLYGRQFTIQSDHKPLSFLFCESKSIPQMASSRVQRWALALSAYQYNIEYKAGSRLCHADALSRLPRPVTTNNNGQTPEMNVLINHLTSTCTIPSQAIHPHWLARR